MKYYHAVVCVFAVCFLFGCELKEEREFRFDSERFYKERKQWDDLRLQNYTFTQDFFSGAGPSEMKIEIKTGKPKVLFCSSGHPSQNEPSKVYCDLGLTISEVYSFIEESVRDSKKSYDSGRANLVRYEISYDPDYHYPKTVSESISYKDDPDRFAWGFDLKITEFTKK